MKCFSRLKNSADIIKKDLYWQGAFDWPGYGCREIPNVEGVYLWTFPYKKGYVLYCAGVTKSMKDRFKFHTRQYKRGKYTVLDIDEALNGERKEIWHGWKYAKMHQDEFIAKKDSILKAVDNQLKAFRIFIIEEKDPRLRYRIEAAIMHNIYMSKESYTELADRGMNLISRYNYEIPIVINNICDFKIYGIKKTMEI